MRRLLAAALTMSTVPVLCAQTSDRRELSRRLECILELGIAHSHCWAYCRAMDCDADSPIASRKACRRVKAQWQEMTGRHHLPCERGAGPACTVEDLWLAFVLDNQAKEYECLCDLNGKLLPWRAYSADQDCSCRRCWESGYRRCLAGWYENGRSVCKCQ